MWALGYNASCDILKQLFHWFLKKTKMDSQLYCLGKSCPKYMSCKNFQTELMHVRKYIWKGPLDALPKLQKNIVLSSNSSSELWEVISPEITIAIGLQLLGLGASYIILTSAYGVSASSVFVARSLSVNAANLGQELKVATNRLHIEIKHPQGKRVGVPPIHITLDIFLAMAWTFKQLKMQVCTSYSSLLLPLGSHLTRMLWKQPPFIQSFLSVHLICILKEILLTLILIHTPFARMLMARFSEW